MNSKSTKPHRASCLSSERGMALAEKDSGDEKCSSDWERSERSHGSRHGEKHRNDTKKDNRGREQKEREKPREKESNEERDDRWRNDRRGEDEMEKSRGKNREKDKERERRASDLRRDSDKEKEGNRPRRNLGTEDDRRRDRDARDKEIRRKERDERDREKEDERKGERGDRDVEKEESRKRDRDERDKEESDHRRDRGQRQRDRVKEKSKEKEKDRGREKDKEETRVKDKDKDKARTKNRDSMKENAKEVEKKSEKLREEARVIDDNAQNQCLKGEGGARGEEENTKDHREKVNQAFEHSQPSSLELADRLKRVRVGRKKKADEGSEISAWVNRSRKLEEKASTEKEKALQLAKVFEEQDNMDEESHEDEDKPQHTGKDLAGVKILHGLDKVIEGGAVVLTLKDQGILADGDINNDVDMLENVEIGEQKQRDEAYKAAKKQTGIYEDKFSVDALSQKTILPQYDDPNKDEGITLDESGSISREAERKLEELRKRLEGSSTGNMYEDLTTMTKMPSDYYTQEEMLQFRKPKKKKSLRKKEKLDLDAMEAEAISTGLGAGDLGSRKDNQRQLTKEELEKAEAQVRQNAYQSAYKKAEEASRSLRGELIQTVDNEDEDPVFGDDDELFLSMNNARKLALKRKGEEASSVPAVVANLALSASQSHEEAESQPTGEVQDNKIVFTEMDEFVWALQLDEDAHKSNAEDVFKDEDTIQTEQKDVEGGWMEVKETASENQPKEKLEEEIVPDDTIHETPVGRGLAAALQLLKERGTLKESVDWGGRTMDKKKSKLLGIRDNEGPKEISLDRLDEFGRVMTPKEAFRKLSHKFHGKGPGKMKQEKRMKQYEEELKLKQMKASDTPLLSMEKMRETQAKQNTPYIVLSGQIKPGQTSDPRSGFATVEKDHPGNLTPMLGDRKVEHFLGIKRKAEPSNLGPPKKAKT